MHKQRRLHKVCACLVETCEKCVVDAHTLFPLGLALGQRGVRKLVLDGQPAGRRSSTSGQQTRLY
jgi:hypothetical protein